jgi:enoyl-CoA hydratase/carnithine racemase
LAHHQSEQRSVADLEFSIAGHNAHVRLNRPHALNAITPQMDDAMYDAWTRINEDASIWAVILSAEGEKSFSIGADVSGGTDRTGCKPVGGGLTGIGGALVTCRKPMIAAVQGFCVGAGFELAMCADIIVAADTAQFGLPETKVGIIGECGVVHRAIRQLPYHIAMQLILTGERIKAEEARGFGLVNEVVPFSDLADAAERWATKLNAASPLAVQAAKAAALSRLGYPLEVALTTRFEAIERYAETEDKREGERAAAERRKPVWKGR